MHYFEIFKKASSILFNHYSSNHIYIYMYIYIEYKTHIMNIQVHIMCIQIDKGLTPVLEVFVGTMHEGACEQES